MKTVILFDPPHRGDPRDEVWLTHEVCQVSGLYEDQYGHVLPFLAGEPFTCCAHEFGEIARRRLVFFIASKVAQ